MLWKPEKRLSYLPEDIVDYFRSDARYLHRNLESNQLQIGTAPAPDRRHSGHKIRIVIVYNPS